MEILNYFIHIYSNSNIIIEKVSIHINGYKNKKRNKNDYISSSSSKTVWASAPTIASVIESGISTDCST